MMNLFQYLNEYQIKQIEKFNIVRGKHPTDDVCDDKTDWSEMQLNDLFEHLEKEMEELKRAFMEYNLTKIGEECVDVSNMAFLIYTKAQLRRKELYNENGILK